jgi:hypothetical protein
VVRERLVDTQQHVRGGGIGQVRVGRAAGVAGDHRVAVDVGVVDEEEAVLGVARVERQAEEAALAAAADEVADVEERLRPHVRRLQDADPAALLDDEEAGIAGVGDGHRLGETIGDRLQCDHRLRLGNDGGKDESGEVHAATACKDRERFLR